MFIVEEDNRSYVSEAYRTLRTNIKYSNFDNDLKCVIVTSSAPGEGKSTTTGNLALTMVQEGKKVLIVDCDMRKPTVHKKFGISNVSGLSNYIIGDVTFEEAVNKYNDNLYILTSGEIPPNPSEMLSSKRMKEFIEKIKQEFDFILLDTPPVLAVTDAQILSTIADGVILVVASGQAEKEAVLKAKELLVRVKANIIGTVLNKIPVDENGKGDKYSYYYYEYGEENDKKKKKRGNKK